MKLKSLTKEQIIRICLFSAFQAFAIGSMLYSLFGMHDYESAFVCVTTMFFLCLPDLLGKLFRFKVPLPVYVFSMFYGIAHMLGHTYGFYYNVPYWDKILHVTGGVVFALFGAYLPKLILKKDDCNVVLCALFGVCFSVFICVLWEFFEFTSDSLLHTDMQKDALIDRIYSYELGELLGKGSGVVEGLPDLGGLVVTNDGQVLFEGKYLDVGLMDTMGDMLVETAGAIIFAVVYILDKGVHTSFKYVGKKKESVAEEKPLSEAPEKE